MSGIQFSSPVTNQKASPAVYASSLATRPSPQLPGRIFVDTDNPSTGMYRDTGTAWVQISSGSGGTPDLQSVCNVGFLTDTDMTFLYSDSLDTSKIGFLNQDVGDFSFDIIKKPSELFCIRALKPSTVNEEMELIFDAPSNVIKTNYNSIDYGLLIDFGSSELYLGDLSGATLSVIEMIGRNINIRNINNNFSLKFDDNNAEIVSTFGGPDVGMKLSFTANEYLFGDFGYVFNGHSLIIDDGGEIIYTKGSNTQNGLILDFGSEKFTLGSTTEYIGIDTLNNTLIAGANLTSGTSGGNSGQHLKININGTNYKIELKNP